jgi:hypothetical protein
MDFSTNETGHTTRLRLQCASFRSFICFGSGDCRVSLDQFNKNVIQPYSNYECQLVLPAAHVPIQFQLLASDAQTYYFTRIF